MWVAAGTPRQNIFGLAHLGMLSANIVSDMRSIDLLKDTSTTQPYMAMPPALCAST